MRKTRFKTRLGAEINMVPFTDVVLVLLVIFMVTTPLLIQGQIKVRLPKANAPASQVEPATVSISAEGKIYLRDQEVVLDQLGALLKPLLAGESDKMVIINADRATTHGRVVAVLDVAKAAGAERLAIATDQTK